MLMLKNVRRCEGEGRDMACLLRGRAWWWCGIEGEEEEYEYE